MDTAKLARQQSKRALTARINALSRHIAEQRSWQYVADKRQQLMDTFDDFHRASDSVDELSETEKEKDACLTYVLEAETAYTQVLRAANEYIKSERDSGDMSRPDSTVSAVIADEPKYDPAVHLPKIEIKKFNGDPTTYHQFIATFEETLHLLFYLGNRAKRALF